ncbi:MAG: biliverdin-producing heme oxygenase [Bacteroidota bacterium]|nr:biliverdin-producing heme oxygenase [Candidatus Kapabacteria bacterium]MDW8220274.1 biliverdin-producing heme oxygenase [Bacteroidota bacterium]
MTERPRILVKLKAQTRPQHDSIEGNRFGKAMMDGTLSEADYLLFLQKFYGFHVPLERLLRRINWSSAGIDIEQRCKARLLERDLLSLGMTQDEIASLPEASTLPSMSTIQEAAGVLYVMEGSTLGGQIQARQVQKMYGRTADNGAAYFSSYGAHVGAMWKSCCEAIARIADNNEENEAVIIASAQQTFQALEHWLAVESSIESIEVM